MWFSWIQSSNSIYLKEGPLITFRKRMRNSSDSGFSAGVLSSSQRKVSRRRALVMSSCASPTFTASSIPGINVGEAVGVGKGVGICVCVAVGVRVGAGGSVGVEEG